MLDLYMGNQLAIDNSLITFLVPPRLCPYMIVSTQVFANTRLCPDTFVPRHICAQT